MSDVAATVKRNRPAFTLVELLTVIGIMALLIGILLPTVISVRRSSERNTVRMSLQTIGMALDAYKADFGDYPRPPDSQRKYRVLAWALIGPYDAEPTTGPTDPFTSTPLKDGADGAGFRTVFDKNTGKGGKIWGPYLPTDKFPLTSSETPSPQQWDLMDRYGRPIEYYPQWRKSRPNLFGKGAVTDAIYDFRQQWQADPTATPSDTYQGVQYLRKALGDDDLSDKIDGQEALKETPPFLLISRGASAQFPDDTTIKTKFEKCDVITNLQH
jgi:type II secretory pathway pseudopilin PulG